MNILYKYKVSNLRCNKCNDFYERREHAIITPKLLKKIFYYSEWDYCKKCKHVQHYEQYKVWNKHTEAQYIQMKEEMDNLFKDI